jgi:hypothetical protein
MSSTLVGTGSSGSGSVARDSRVALPAPGEVREIPPETFAIANGEQPDYLTDNYVSAKYAENAGLIAQHIRYE